MYRTTENDRMEGLEKAAYELNVYHNHLDVLLFMHKQCANEEVNAAHAGVLAP